MTAGDSSGGAVIVVSDREIARSWGWVLALGILGVIVGIVFLAAIKVAVFTLAVIVCIALLISGIFEIALAKSYPKPWIGYLIGVVWIGVAIAALVWPKVTLAALAVLVGIGLLVAGLARAIFAVASRHTNTSWGWPFVGGVISALAGIFCMVWPHATVLVLAVILGLRTLIGGLVDIALAFRLRSAAKAGLA